MKSEKGKRLSPKEAFHLALKEAEKGRGWVSPNPLVGAVFLDKNNCFLSSGYHKAYGKPHAEQEALNNVKDKKSIKGGHLYVTLEPCSHTGKTPPCTDLLLKLSLSSITYGMKDPNPKMQGKSLKLLESKGIKVKPSLYFKEEAKNLYKTYSFNQTYKKPFVALKVATSLDGMIALNQGSSQWISSEKSRDYVSYLRACYDAVLIGVGTFLEDNPRLNSRKKPFHEKKNKVVILDPKGYSLDLISQSNLAKVRPPSHIIICVEKNLKIKKSPFKIIEGSFEDGEFDLDFLLKALHYENLSSVLVEGGAQTFSTFIKQNQAQKLYQFIAPSLIGAQNGKNFLEHYNLADLSHKKEFQSVEFLQIGSEVLFRGFFPMKK